ncbi:hypothetical protein [Streptomyces nigrescens]
MILSIVPLAIGVILLWKALDRPSESKSSSEILVQRAANSGVDPFTESRVPKPSASESQAARSQELSKIQRELAENVVSQDAQKREADDVFTMVTGAVSAVGGALSGVAAMTVVRRATPSPEETHRPRHEPPTQ